MTSKKKKVFILVGMVALLVLTGVLNIVLNNVVGNADDVGGSTTYSDFFTSYKADRESSREQSILYYDAIIASAESSKEARDNAESSRQALIQAMDTEQALEGLIMALGFENAVVTSTTQNINVIVKCTELTSTQANQILDIIVTETSASATNVRVIPTE